MKFFGREFSLKSYRLILGVLIALEFAIIISLSGGIDFFPWYFADSEQKFNCESGRVENKKFNHEAIGLVGDEYVGYPPNRTNVQRRPDGTPWVVKTNRFGLREQNISLKNSKEFRIMVVGDSHTFGWGLNASDRFSDVLERDLDERYDRTVKVINLGRTGAGIRDYYFELRDKIEVYRPDLIVTAFYRHDNVNYDDIYRIRRKLLEKHGVNSSEAIMQINEINEDYKVMKQEASQYEGWRGSDFKKYGNKIVKLGYENDIPTVFFYFASGKHSYMHDGLTGDLIKWSRNCNNVNLVMHPEELDQKPREKWRLPIDDHFNSEYHELMASKLERYIESKNFISELS